MATELVEGCWHVRCRGVNCYVLDGPETVLVDAGTPLDAGRIRAGLADADLAPADVDRVLVTHFDLDHVGALWRLDDEIEAPVHVPKPDLGYLTRTTRLPWSRKGVLQRVLRPFARPPDLPTTPVEDGDEVAGLTAHRTPGHTQGHTVYVSEAHGVAFLGDLVFGDGGGFVPSPSFVAEDAGRNAASIRDLAAADYAFGTGCQGHGDPVVTGADDALSSLAADV